MAVTKLLDIKKLKGGRIALGSCFLEGLTFFTAGRTRRQEDAAAGYTVLTVKKQRWQELETECETSGSPPVTDFLLQVSTSITTQNARRRHVQGIPHFNNSSYQNKTRKVVLC